MFVMDRETGEFFSAEKFEPVTWANGFDLKTGHVSENMDKRTHFGKYTKGICPSSTGGKEFVPSSFSPQTGYLYIPAHNTCMDYEGTAVNYIAGTPYLGASVRMYPGPGGYQGEFMAWDVANAKKVWSIKEPDFPVYSGVLSTGGDLVFYGTMDGWFRAVDARIRQNAVAVQNVFGNRRQSDDLHRPGWQAICRHLFRNWRMDGRDGAAVASPPTIRMPRWVSWAQ